MGLVVLCKQSLRTIRPRCMSLQLGQKGWIQNHQPLLLCQVVRCDLADDDDPLARLLFLSFLCLLRSGLSFFSASRFGGDAAGSGLSELAADLGSPNREHGLSDSQLESSSCGTSRTSPAPEPFSASQAPDPATDHR